MAQQVPPYRRGARTGEAKPFLTEPVRRATSVSSRRRSKWPAGGSDDWAQWIGGPLDQDYDVIDIKGAQSFGGHHALVYATVDAQAPGHDALVAGRRTKSRRG